jgi:hypothetical protein
MDSAQQQQLYECFAANQQAYGFSTYTAAGQRVRTLNKGKQQPHAVHGVHVSSQPLRIQIPDSLHRSVMPAELEQRLPRFRLLPPFLSWLATTCPTHQRTTVLRHAARVSAVQVLDSRSLIRTQVPAVHLS